MQLFLCVAGSEPTSSLREHIRRRLDGIARLLPHTPLSARMTARESARGHRVKAEVAFGCFTLRAEETGASLAAGTDLALDALETQAREGETAWARRPAPRPA